MYFECSSGTGKGNNLIVTCASDFAGVTITCTNGVKTYSRICPSSEPYEIEFSGLESGTWTISGTVEGTLYSTSVVISDYTATLESGFDYKAWCTEGGVDATQYSSLADVFADELAVHKLMTVHASADYLIEAVTDDVDVIDDFVANDTAMKWIGLRDYVCDGLTAINGVVAKFLASDYWKRYLKDHVPTMTSNTAPYGVASASNSYNQVTTYYPWYAFNGDTVNVWLPNVNVSNANLTYAFPTPICPKKCVVNSRCVGGYTPLTFDIKGSNDDTNWTTIKSNVQAQDGVQTVDLSNNDDYFMQLDYFYNGVMTTSGVVNIALYSLQFYGRSLNVSVPVMTSNTAPFGEAIADSYYTSAYAPYKAFDNKNNSTDGRPWASVSSSGYYVGYKFNSLVNVKMVAITNRNDGTIDGSPTSFKIQGSVNGDWEDATETINRSTSSQGEKTIHSVDGNLRSDEFIVKILSTTNNASACIGELQFYGVDYSEREFEPSTNKKWLYDYGLELETITTSGTVTKGDDYLTLSAANSEATATIDLTDYSLLRGKCGDHLSGTTQLSVGGSNPATTTLTTNYAPNNFSLGTSLFDQPLATGVKMTANGICDITELWLE